MRRVPFQMVLDRDLKTGLERLKRRTGRTIAEHARRAIADYLARHGTQPLTAADHSARKDSTS